jgi:predicted TIM-barrel fold metal-dependent hydrolase
MEKDEEIMDFLEPPFAGAGRNAALPGLLPSLDRFHTPGPGQRTSGAFDVTVGPERWAEFLDRTGLDLSVLYPTVGLAFGQVVLPDWARAYARAYNNWLYERYTKPNPRLKGMALLPMQDVPEAVAELRRAVTEMGFLGGMIPSNGLTRHVSHREYWPIYEEAERLDCAIAVHGGSYGGLGFDTFTARGAPRALGMPIPLAIAMTGMMVDGLFEAFPKLRVGFLEGGTSWIPMVIDRLERERLYGGLKMARPAVEYFRGGQFFVGCEGNEEALAYAMQRIGPEPFMFCSDFPHEITLNNCMEEIDEILERHDIAQEHKPAILGDNARRFYRQ